MKNNYLENVFEELVLVRPCLGSSKFSSVRLCLHEGRVVMRQLAEMGHF